MMDVLGEQVLGEISGFDWGGAVKGVFNVAETGVQQYQSDEDKKKAAAADAAALAKAIAADAEWANAEANLELAAGDPTAQSAAKTMADKKRADAQAAGVSLSSDATQKRCQTAHDQYNQAATAVSGAPSDIAKQAKFHAWKKVSDACGTPSSGGGSGLSPSGGGTNFLTQVKGGLPVWGWTLIGVGGVTALVLVIRAMAKGRK
jgi:hypothetical protein